MTYKFTNSCNKAIEIASEIAMELGHSYIGTEHVLYGLMEEGNGIASKVLNNQGITSQKVLDTIEGFVGREEPVNQIVDFTPRTKRVIEISFLEARKLGYNYIGTEHLLIAILKEGDSIAQGQQIGEVGSTGRTTGPHLHFEIRKAGRTVNPEYVLSFA